MAWYSSADMTTFRTAAFRWVASPARGSPAGREGEARAMAGDGKELRVDQTNLPSAGFLDLNFRQCRSLTRLSIPAHPRCRYAHRH